MKKSRWLPGFLAGAAVVSILAVAVTFIWRVNEIRGRVISEGKPISNATVSLKATGIQTKTDTSGRFLLDDFPRRFYVTVTAWQDGYYIGGQTVFPWESNITLELSRYSTTDNQSYQWLPPVSENRSFVHDLLARIGLPVAARLSFQNLFLPLSEKLPLGCADCHPNVTREFVNGAHAKGAGNIIFQTVYNGTDTQGNRSPLTSYGVSRDYGRFPLRPDTTKNWYGPGFKLDFPDQAGNCANCHMPGEAINHPNDTDVNAKPANILQSTQCDFCHKTIDVVVNPKTGVPEDNMAGVLSMKFLRPDGPQVFQGPYADVDVGPDTFSPLQNESRFCAGCHNASFWGTPIYQSYAEWLKSPYPDEGVTCQTCHMKPDGKTTDFAPGRGGTERDPQTIFSHSFPGAADVDLLRHTAKLELKAVRNGDRINVEARVTNINGGHDIPTDEPMRNILLVISATDSTGKQLVQLDDQKVPEWGGTGTAANDYADMPGKGYAKVLQELWTEVSPTIAYWRQTKILEDTRIPARATDVTNYEFQAPANGNVTIEAKLIFRRAFIDLARVKKWNLEDIEMEKTTVSVNP
ncbi:MAG: hypothetical protein Q7R50_07220 [Dehalococcoidales bacterium]|nr:hypothetical protein [Dehalococcoidales bacterium]